MATERGRKEMKGSKGVPEAQGRDQKLIPSAAVFLVIRTAGTHSRLWPTLLSEK